MHGHVNVRKVMFVIRENICLGITHIDGEQVFYSTVLLGV